MRGTRNDSVTTLEEFYPTPSDIPAGTRCLTLHIPDSAEWYGLAVGALWELMRWQNYEKNGIDVDLTIDTWLEVFRTMEVNCVTTPIGGTMMWWHATPPEKWLILNGQTISKTTYPELFDIYGYTYGGGFDSFVLPTMRGYSPYGAGAELDLHLTAGSLTRSLNTGNLPAHNHPVVDPGHNHQGSNTGSFLMNGGTGTKSHQPFAGSTGRAEPDTSTKTTGITTGNTGDGNFFNILHPVRACHFIVYAGH